MTSKEAKTHIIDTLNGDMNKEYFINELLPEILKDLERLEEFEKVLNGHCSKCVNRENNICVGMDAPIHIDTLINCIEMENQELKDKKDYGAIYAVLYDNEAGNVVLNGNNILTSDNIVALAKLPDIDNTPEWTNFSDDFSYMKEFDEAKMNAYG